VVSLYIENLAFIKSPKAFYKLGINLNTNPKKIKVFWKRRKMLPLSNNIYYPSDLTENAIQLIGENDGIFDNEDYILFYAEGIDTYNVESQTYNNLYDSKSYYYITTSGGDGKGLRKQTNPMVAAT
jgi:hypothetical protein